MQVLRYASLFSLRLKFKSLFSVKDKVTQCYLIKGNQKRNIGTWQAMALHGHSFVGGT